MANDTHDFSSNQATFMHDAADKCVLLFVFAWPNSQLTAQTTINFSRASSTYQASFETGSTHSRSLVTSSSSRPYGRSTQRAVLLLACTPRRNQPSRVSATIPS